MRVILCKPPREQRMMSPNPMGTEAAKQERFDALLRRMGVGRTTATWQTPHSLGHCTVYTLLSSRHAVQSAYSPMPSPPGTTRYPPLYHLLLGHCSIRPHANSPRTTWPTTNHHTTSSCRRYSSSHHHAACTGGLQTGSIRFSPSLALPMGTQCPALHP